MEAIPAVWQIKLNMWNINQTNSTFTNHPLRGRQWLTHTFVKGYRKMVLVTTKIKSVLGKKDSHC